MTADVKNENSTNPDEDGIANVDGEIETEVESTLPMEILEIFEYLSSNEKIVFKSQQIDDPELQHSEKVFIARDIYTKNRQTFLMRFGSFLEERHLEDFARLALSDGAASLSSDEYYEEIQFMLKEYQRKLHTRKQDVKNRRYTVMQQLVEQGEYFSEKEMMKRAPELYQDLIGQYLSESEKKQRDSYDVKNTTFSGILMHTMERKQMEDILQKADKENKTKSCINWEENDDNPRIHTTSFNSFQQTSDSTDSNEEDNDVDVPQSYRQQWGNFDNEKIACSTSQFKNHKKTSNFMEIAISNARPVKQQAEHDKLITAGERDLLRQEFIRIMHEQFLSGNDKDFDYTHVDDNSQLDDLRQLDQDKEDAYFEESDNEEFEEEEEIKHFQEESEDELDVYMSHLSKHHSLQN